MLRRWKFDWQALTPFSRKTTRLPEDKSFLSVSEGLKWETQHLEKQRRLLSFKERWRKITSLTFLRTENNTRAFFKKLQFHRKSANRLYFKSDWRGWNSWNSVKLNYSILWNCCLQQRVSHEEKHQLHVSFWNAASHVWMSWNQRVKCSADATTFYKWIINVRQIIFSWVDVHTADTHTHTDWELQETVWSLRCCTRVTSESTLY